MSWLLTLIAFALPSYLVRFSVFGIPTTLLELLIYSVTLVALASLVKRFRLPRPSWHLCIPVVAILLAGVISVYLAPDRRLALGLYKAYLFDPVLVLGLVWYLRPGQKDLIKIIWALIISASAVALHAIYQYFTGQVTLDGRVVGVFGYSPNYLALYLAPILVLALGFWLGLLVNRLPGRIFTKIILLVAILLMGAALLLTGSRGGIGATLIGTAFYGVCLGWQWIRIRAWALATLTFVVLASMYLGWLAIKPDFSVSPESGRIATSNNLRWEVWKTTFEIIGQKPVFGVGLGNYQSYFTELTKDRVNYPEFIAPKALTPHNIFLNFWVNLGILGLVGFVWLIVQAFYRGFKDQKILTVIFMAAIVCILIHGLVDSPYWKNDLAIFFWLLSGIILFVKGNNSQTKS